MLSKLTTTHIVLIFIGVAAIGILIGSKWDTWFMTSKNAAGNNDDLSAGRKACPKVNGSPCCHPRFNSSTNSVECDS